MPVIQAGGFDAETLAQIPNDQVGIIPYCNRPFAFIQARQPRGRLRTRRSGAIPGLRAWPLLHSAEAALQENCQKIQRDAPAILRR